MNKSELGYRRPFVEAGERAEKALHPEKFPQPIEEEVQSSETPSHIGTFIAEVAGYELGMRYLDFIISHGSEEERTQAAETLVGLRDMAERAQQGTDSEQRSERERLKREMKTVISELEYRTSELEQKRNSVQQKRDDQQGVIDASFMSRLQIGSVDEANLFKNPADNQQIDLTRWFELTGHKLAYQVDPLANDFRHLNIPSEIMSFSMDDVLSDPSNVRTQVEESLRQLAKKPIVISRLFESNVNEFKRQQIIDSIPHFLAWFDKLAAEVEKVRQKKNGEWKDRVIALTAELEEIQNELDAVQREVVKSSSVKTEV